MGKTSYNNISDLIADLNKKLQDLNKGNLDINQIEPLVEQSKELYERLVVLRYKVYEKFGEPEVKIEKEEEKEETAFDFTGFSEEEKIEEEPTKEVEINEPVEDEINEESSIEEETAVEDVIEPEKTEPIEEDVQVGFDFSTTEEKQVIDEDEKSLHDQLKREEDEQSLRKKLQGSPIKDIKSEITIARRFEYISILFENDGDAYDEAINQFNSCSDGEDAREKLNHYSNKYNWNLENKAIVKFVELVERRYL